MEMDCIGLFVNNMKKMVKFYRDIMGLETNWNGDPNAEFKAGNCHLIMFGRNDFEKMVSKEFNYPKGLTGTMEIAFNLWGFNSPPLGAVETGGAGDLFPRIRKDFKEKSSIPRRSAAGIFYFKKL